SVSYSEDDLEALDGPVLLYVGRYTEVKRIPLLVRAWASARERFEQRAALVLVGGYPGEWEGEHPLEVVRDTGAEDVFLAGWHGQAAYEAARSRYSWPSLVEGVAQVYDEVREGREPPGDEPQSLTEATE